MLPIEERVMRLFGTAIEVQTAIADSLSADITKAALRLVQCLLNDGKILLCGNGGSAANCMHFTSAMLNHFEVERPALPVINLSAEAVNISAFASEVHYNTIFSRQIHALAQPSDVLLLLTTTGNADSILGALKAAHERGMDAIALNGRDGGILANRLAPGDIELRIPSDNAARIRELHLFILHCFCDVIDQSLFGQVLG
jgi:D-sedoheptulose 7-phosphate isomerase